MAPDLFKTPSKTSGPAQVMMQAADQELPAQLRLVRSRLVSLDAGALDPDNAARPRRLRLNFFADSAFEVAERIARRRGRGRGFEWFGSLADGLPAQAVLSVIEGRVNGSLGTGQAHYQIRHIEGDLHLVQEVLIEEVPTDDALVPDLPAVSAGGAAALLEQKASGPASVNAAGAPVLDVLVCYTTRTRQLRGGSQAVQDRIQLAISEANASFFNSRIPLEFNLVGMVEIDGERPGLTEAPNAPYIEDITFNRTDIHALRDYYGADLVSVWVNNASGSVVGIGWVFQGGPGFSNYAYNVVSYPFAAGPSYTFAHETGHNMGAAHDRANAGVNGRFDYSYGYRRSSADPKFYSIMAYSAGCSGCQSVNHWSNPLVDIEINGAVAASGVAEGEPDSADNAKTFTLTGPVQAEYRAPTAPPPNQAPQPASQTVELEANASRAITLFAFDPDSDPLSYDISALPLHGSLVGAGTSWTYTPETDYIGPDEFRFHVRDNRGGFATATVSIEVAPASGHNSGDSQSAAATHWAEVITASVANRWQTVELTNSYTSPVIICTPQYEAGSPSITPRIRNVDASSFELQMARMDNSTSLLSPLVVRCFVVEEGVYSVAEHGVKMEAVKYESTVTDRYRSWAGEARSYANSYSSPVVLGQVMSSNDERPSTFWARGVFPWTQPTNSLLYVGKSIGEDPIITRAHETVGYLVFESGVGAIGGLTVEAGVATNIYGFDLAPPYAIPLATSPTGAALSPAGMAGDQGGWPLLYGANPIQPQRLQAAFDEDQFLDSERVHVAERVAYLAWTALAGANQDPTADPQTLSAAFETALPITLTGSDPDFDPLSFAIVSAPAHGALSGAAPNLTYTPNAGYTGPDSFVFSVNDGRGGLDQALVSITVEEAANRTPTANPQSLTTLYETALTITLTGSDPDLDSLSFAIVTPPAHGALSGTAPNIIYTPAAGYSGPDAFTFSVDDGRGGADQAVVSITVGAEPPPPPPVGTLTAEGVTTTASSEWTTVALTNSYLSPVIVCTPEYGAGSPAIALRLRNVAGSSFELQFARTDNSSAPLSPHTARCLVVEEGVYTLAAHGIQLEAVRYTSTVTDRFRSWTGEARSYANSYANPVVVGQVMSANDPRPSTFWARGVFPWTQPTNKLLYAGKSIGEDPVTTRADETVGYIVFEAGVGSIGGLTVEAGVATNILGYDFSPPYPIQLATSPTGAVLSPAGMAGDQGGWPMFYGPDPIQPQLLQTAFDEDQFLDAERIHVGERVAYAAWTAPTGPNQDPTADSQTLSTPYQTALPITLSGSDPDFDSLIFAVLTPPAHGLLSGTAPHLTYTPAAGYSGPDSFAFSVNDGRGGLDEAVVSITVEEAPNQAPTADPQSLGTPYETALPITLSGSDPDLDPLTFAVVTPPASGSLSGTAPNVTYTPGAGYSGPDAFSFSVDDGRGGVDQALISITVGSGTNQDPTANPQSVSTPYETALPITLSGSDPDFDALTFAIVTTPAHGSLSGTAPNVTYTPAAGYSGPDAFTFSVNDGRDGVAQAVVSITVGAAPPPPGTLNAEGITTTASSEWKTVSLTNSYSSPVVVCTPEYGAGSPSVATRVRNASGSSFELQMARMDNSTAPLAGLTARCLVVEEGVYTIAQDGIKLEAVRYNSTVTDRYRSWTGEERSYANSYANPVVVGQVMSANDARPATFWARGGRPWTQPTGSVLYVGKSIGEDPVTTRADETVGYLVFEAGLGFLAGMTIEAGVGANILGYDFSPPYPIDITTHPTGAVLGVAGMAGDQGGWPLLYGPDPIAPQQLKTAFDEDQLLDSERIHVGERVAFVAWTITETPTPNQDPVADPQALATAYETALPITLTGSDPDFNGLTFAIVAPPTFGSLSGEAPEVTYTPNAGYSGPDSFTFSVNDGRGGTDQAVISITVEEFDPNIPPAAQSQQLVTSYQTPLSITLSAFDTEDINLSFQVVEQPGQGALSGDAPHLLYTPNAGFSGRDSFVFSADDGRGGVGEARVWISVAQAVNVQQLVISTADELHDALFNAAPGEEYLLAPGEYAREPGRFFATSSWGLIGLEENPIIFRAQDPANPPTISALMLLQSPRYVEFHNIRFVNPPDDGHSINIYPVTGVTPADVTFDGCYFEMRPELISLANIKATHVDNLFVRNTTFHGWGDEAISTVGLWGGVIENNVFRGKPTHRQRAALQFKGDSRDVIIRNNYFEEAGDRVMQAGGATGHLNFRAPAQFEASNIEMYGNRIVGGDACFSISTQNGSRFHHNTCYLPARWVGRLLHENDRMEPNQNGTIDHNLFLYTGDLGYEFVNRSNNFDLSTFVFDSNAFFQIDGDNPEFPALPTPDVHMVNQIDPELIDPGTERMRIGSTNPVFDGIGADAVNPVP